MIDWGTDFASSTMYYAGAAGSSLSVPATAIIGTLLGAVLLVVLIKALTHHS